ncbi:Sorting nexin-17 [Dermatophagoides pteronyssinus]|uniref:Sorting nexin-17 n=1 Tax=Dermatophagoides pteronyssinus TaxID=6956 RepID=A0ABQ8JS87_DERPT|nr:Sorting nexin-17 [Dermatophagoides pteronyssinus]
MHFSIPETKEIKNGFKTFITYQIYINGSFHCSLRYRQLYHFHIQLKKVFGANSLPNFPPKKFFPLNSQHIEERRSQLEKYIQIVSQDSQIINSDIFNGFLLAAQQESHNNDDDNNDNNLDIYQLDWQPIRLTTNGQENSENVLRKFCQTIQMNSNHVPYFALFLIERFIIDNNDNDNKPKHFRIIRRLQNFESPLLTLRTIQNRMHNNIIIIIYKSYFNIEFDQDLFDDQIALNCIFLQTVQDIENGHIVCNDRETRRRLNHLKMKQDKLEYIRLARLQKFYGYFHFESCYCDLPSMPAKANVTIFAGNQELIIRVDNQDQEYSFRIIRIKCWRLTTSTANNNNNPQTDLEILEHQESTTQEKGRFELSFEYLINKGTLQWITIYSSQAVLISYCLQSMVEEMLLKREGKKFRSEGLTIRYNTSPNLRLTNSNSNQIDDQLTLTNINDNNLTTTTTANNDNNFEWNYYKQDGSSTKFPLSTSSSTTTLTSEKSHCSSSEKSIQHNDQIEQKPNGMTDPLMLQQRFQEISIVENNIFDEIGDDDL